MLMNKWKLKSNRRRVLFVIFWTIIAVVGFILESNRVPALMVYILQVCFVFIHEIMRSRRQEADMKMINYVIDDMFFWLFPISRAIIVFMI